MPAVRLDELLASALRLRRDYELGSEVFPTLGSNVAGKSTTMGSEACLGRSGARTRDDDEIHGLRESVKRLDGLGIPIDRARANAELGAALRRLSRPVEAREPLRVAVDLAHRCGACDLEDWAMGELRATGARPRRRVMTGAEALTPSERRIAELAAAGHRNRDIAEILVVTLATVEFHLRNAYRKLGIASRTALNGVLPVVPDVGPRVVGSSLAVRRGRQGCRGELRSGAATSTSWCVDDAE
jgi:DNA-binding CsgD family transcriptional regulator